MKVPDILREQDFYAIQHLVTAVSSFSVCQSFLILALLAAIRADASKSRIKLLLELLRWNNRNGLPGLCKLSDIVNNDTLVTSPSQTPVPTNFAALGYCLEALFLEDRVLASDLKERCFELMKTARKNGYHYMATILEPCARRLDPAMMQDYVSDIPPIAQCVPLWQESNVNPIWQRALDSLHELLPDEATALQSDTAASHFVKWRVGVRSQYSVRNKDKAELVEVVSICLKLHKRLKSGKWSSGRLVNLEKIINGECDNYFDDADHAIKAALSKIHSYYYYDTTPSAVVEALIGHPRIYVTKNAYSHQEDGEGPVEFVKRAASVEVKNLADGGITLRLPATADNFSVPLQIIRERDDCFAVYMYTPTQVKLGGIVERFGKGRELRLPSEAVASFQNLLPALAREVGVRGEFDAAAIAARTIEGSTQLVLRGKFVNDTLHLELLNQPTNDLPLYVTPGIGMRNTLTQLEDETVAVVRDLAAEKRAAAKFKTGCPALDNWDAGGWRWEVNDLYSMLNVLDECYEQAESVPLEWPERDAMAIVRPTGSSSFRLSAVGGSDFWLEIGGDVELDDGQVMAFTKLLAQTGDRMERFIRLSDKRFMRLTRHLAEQLELLAKVGESRANTLRVPQGALPILEAIAEKTPEISFPAEVRRRISDFRKALERNYTIPTSMTCELRQYQRDGFEWLAKLDGCGLGACLADDMGLGKTLQALALLTHSAKRGPSLVIAPTSVLRNWQKEAFRFAPALNLMLLADAEDRAALVGRASPYDVVVCSYGLLLFEEELLTGRDWNIVVLDEAQAVKNRLSKRAKAVKRIRSIMRVAATGTPVENNLAELWNLFDFLNPGLLGSHRQFEERFCNPDGSVKAVLKRFTSPFILRRLKTDVLDDLPTKTEITLTVTLDESERALYESCRRDAMNTIVATADEPNPIVMLAQLTRLRRLCCHPSLVLHNSTLPGQKVEEFMELVADLKSGGHRALVFSQFVDFLTIIRARLDKVGIIYQYLDGATPMTRRNKAVESFQRGEGDLFLISLKAGGTGLNLASADYVVLLDPWWNPAVESQAADRAHRIGQTKPVTVYRLVTADTVEERVIELHAHKRAIADAILDNTGDTRLTAEDFMGLLT